MDADGLPIVGPSIDYTKVEAINQKRTIAFLNHFLTHTARFLNRFSCVCEEKLSQLSLRIQRLETTMNILDTKLSSIPGLENVTVSTASTNGPTAESTTSATPVTTQDTTTPAEPSQPADTEVYVAVEEAKPEKTVSQDERYSKFFKMLNMGVPMMAVKQKMGFEGLDPSLIENPHAPAPPDDGMDVMADDDSDDDAFSDEDNSSASEMSD